MEMNRGRARSGAGGRGRTWSGAGGRGRARTVATGRERSRAGADGRGRWSEIFAGTTTSPQILKPFRRTLDFWRRTERGGGVRVQQEVREVRREVREVGREVHDFPQVQAETPTMGQVPADKRGIKSTCGGMGNGM